MSKSRGAWKLQSDGKSVRRNIVAQYFSSRPVELLTSPAFRVLSRAAHLALCRIEIELRQHGGHANGKLIVTTQQFAEYGIHRRMVPAALRELAALGVIRVTVRGRGGNAERRRPNRFLLNYTCGAVDAHEEVTNAWSRIQTLLEAEKIAAAARAAKDQDKVAYGRRIARRQKHFSGTQSGPSPGAQSGPETAKFPGTQSGPTGPGTHSGPIIDISGGGGAAGGILVSAAKATSAPGAEVVAAALTTPALTELPLY
jgi:hypothetical protein